MVRQAINEAIDRGKIVRTALNNRGQPADGPIWPYHWAYHSATSTYTYNPDAARLRLDAAGLQLTSTPGQDMPRRFRFTCAFWSEDPQFERIALVVQKQLFEIGIDVEMIPMTLRDLQGRLGAGDFEAVLIPDGQRSFVRMDLSVLALRAKTDHSLGIYGGRHRARPAARGTVG